MIIFRRYAPRLMTLGPGGEIGHSLAMFYLSAFLGFVCLCIVSVIRKHREQTRTLPGQARTVPRKGREQTAVEALGAARDTWGRSGR